MSRTMRVKMKPGCELPSFAEREMSVTLTGAQWFAVMAALVGRSLSPEGVKQFNAASKALREQLMKAHS